MNLNNFITVLIVSAVVKCQESSLTLKQPRFRLAATQKLPINPDTFKCKNISSETCQRKTVQFKQKVIIEFNRLLADIIEEPNYYNVDDEKITPKTESPICLVMNAKVRTLRKRDVPFNTHKLGDLFPKKNFFKRNFKSEKSCAIVSSAGSLKDSQMGRFIDLHDVVARFNHAPVDEYERDVGRKTTIRIINSQVVSKQEFNFLDSPMFRNVTMAAWDPGKFNDSLTDWLHSPDFNLFVNYEKYMVNHPDASLYLINPKTVWSLWRSLQVFTGRKIRTNPPSSGFIGLALLLPICSYVDFVDYIPSTRLNKRCHYYDDQINPACTFGAWHPLAAEKMMALAMNSADDYTVFQNGVVRIRRPVETDC